MKRPTAQISGLGRSVPARVMTNYDFAAIGIETTHEWVMERTGISERHIAGPEDSTCSMGANAARIEKALAAMIRAGHGFDLARRLVETPPDPAADPVAIEAALGERS